GPRSAGHPVCLSAFRGGGTRLSGCHGTASDPRSPTHVPRRSLRVHPGRCPPAARPSRHRTVAAPGARRLGPLACPRTARAPPDMPPTTALDAIELVLLLLAAAGGIRYLPPRGGTQVPKSLLSSG